MLNLCNGRMQHVACGMLSSDAIKTVNTLRGTRQPLYDLVVERLKREGRHFLKP